MAICETCGKEYLTKECLRCKNKTESLSEKEKLFKTIRYAIIFFIGLIIFGVIIDIIITSYFIKTVTPITNNINQMTSDMMKQNKKVMQQLEKGFKYPYQNK